MNHLPHVTAAQRTEMRKLKREGWSIPDISLAFSICQPTVRYHTNDVPSSVNKPKVPRAILAKAACYDTFAGVAERYKVSIRTVQTAWRLMAHNCIVHHDTQTARNKKRRTPLTSHAG